MSKINQPTDRLPSELVVVTGTSTGIGAATARELAGRGFHVLAGVLSQEEVQLELSLSPNLEPILLDITNQDHIDALVLRIQDDPQQRPLRALVNNAAIEINAPVEVLPLAQWRHQFEVNLFGQVAMIQALLPTLLMSRGRVINISSVGGKVAMGGYGPYAATKFALEAVSDALRREVEPLGVQVIVVQPSAVTSEMSRLVRAKAERITAEMTSQQRERYGHLMQAMVAQAEAFINQAMSAERAGQLLADLIRNPRPRTRYAIGPSASVMMRLSRLVPDRWLDWGIARAQKSALKSY